MQDIPQIAQMQSVTFPLVVSIVFIFGHFYVYKVLLKSISTNTKWRNFYKAFTIVNLLGSIAYIFVRHNPIIPQVPYFLLSLSLGVLFVLFVATLLYQIASLFIMCLKTHKLRSKWRHKSKVAIFVVSVIMSAYGIYNGVKSPDIKSVQIELDGLSTPLKVTLLSDTHIGGLIESSKVKKIVELTNSLEADMIFLVGDIIDKKLEINDDAVNELGNLRAKYGVFYVLGNHEYFHNIKDIISTIDSLGIKVLLNESVVVDNTINIAGITDLMGYRVGYLQPDIDKALEKTDSNLPTILLSHQPKVAELLLDGQKIDLILSGHTHGGQIFPLSLLVKLQQHFIMGLYKLHNFNQTQLYITQGTGFWGPPMRIGSYREITLISLLPPQQH